MKIALYFSTTQAYHAEPRYYLNFKFTEIKHFEDQDEIPEKNNWEDSYLVHVIENLPVDDIYLNHLGKRFAKWEY